MKIATIANGTRDGQLVVVSPDDQRLITVPAPFGTLQAALENWTAAEPFLRDLTQSLAGGGGQHTVAAAYSAPLPGARQWLDGSAYRSHGALMGTSAQAAMAHIRLVHSDQRLVIASTGCARNENRLWLGPRQTGLFRRSVCETAGCAWPSLAGESRAPAAEYVLERGMVRQARGGRDGLRLPRTDRPRRTHAVALRGHDHRVRYGVKSGFSHRRIDCIAERRGIEMLDEGAARTGYMRFGDRVWMEVLTPDGVSLFGTIDQRIVKNDVPA